MPARLPAQSNLQARSEVCTCFGRDTQSHRAIARLLCYAGPIIDTGPFHLRWEANIIHLQSPQWTSPLQGIGMRPANLKFPRP